MLVRIQLVLVCLILLFGCGKNQLPKLADDATILAFGDSLTQGVGVKVDQSYPTILAELTNLQVINSGISGEVTTDGLVRLQKVLETQQPDLIILLEGGNDILRNHSPSQVKNNLARMILLAKENDIPLILIGVPQKKFFSSVAPFYRELADEFQLVFDDETIADLMRDSSMKSDSVHFNQQGYRKLAENIYQLIVDNGGL